MSAFLPDLIDPWRAVQRRACYAGEIALHQLARLRPLLVETSGMVAYRLEFGNDGDGRMVVHGYTRAVLALQCQRCLEVVEIPVAAELSLALVQGCDEAARLPAHYEPWSLEEQTLCPRDIIEDELLLAVPAIPRHPAGSCVPPGGESLRMPFEHEVIHPFAALARWKSRSDH